MFELRGERVRLRPLRLEDVEPMAAVSQAPTVEQARESLLRQIERAPTLDEDGYLQLMVEGDGELVGDVQARAPKYAFPPGVCEIGITLFESARGRGFGREAVALLTQWLHEQGWERVQASTAVGNVAMRRVLEQLGFEDEGVLRSYAPADEGGGRDDYAMYAAARGHWRS